MHNPTRLAQQALDPKFWGLLWIFNKLIKVGHMFSFPPFYLIQTILSFTTLIDKSFFTTSTNVILILPLPFFVSLT